MNRKGFTFIELLAVLVVVALLLVIISPSIISSFQKSKDSSYNILINNIVTSSKLYYEECEYGDLSSTAKYGEYACKINNNTITINLLSLVKTGKLSVKTSSQTGDKTVTDPRNNSILDECTIKITKDIEKDSNGNTKKVKYTVTDISNNDICPKEYGSVN